jgi:hypothetical protein
MERDRPARAARPQVFDFHFESRADAREAVCERGDERAVPQIAKRRGRNGVEELAPLLALEHRRSARLHDVLRSASRGRFRPEKCRGSHQTHCWREPDSNCWSPSKGRYLSRPLQSTSALLVGAKKRHSRQAGPREFESLSFRWRVSLTCVSHGCPGKGPGRLRKLDPAYPSRARPQSRISIAAFISSAQRWPAERYLTMSSWAGWVVTLTERTDWVGTE